MSEDASYLLDTHIWLWFEEADAEALTPGIVTAMRRAGQENRLVVSPLSIWELAMLEARGRVTLASDCRAWIDQALRAPGLRLAELTPETAVDATRLPGAVHRDPIDRLLIATARQTGAVLVTSDGRILRYAKGGHVRALDARRRRRT